MAVLGVSVCVLGLIMAQLGAYTGGGLLVGGVGVAISVVGVTLEGPLRMPTLDGR